jgi:hypothetical protein
MTSKILAKLILALALVAATFTLAAPPAHALFLCGTETFFFSTGGTCTFNCTTEKDTCSGNVSGTITRVIGACHAC